MRTSEAPVGSILVLPTSAHDRFSELWWQLENDLSLPQVALQFSTGFPHLPQPRESTLRPRRASEVGDPTSALAEFASGRHWLHPGQTQKGIGHSLKSGLPFFLRTCSAPALIRNFLSVPEDG